MGSLGLASGSRTLLVPAGTICHGTDTGYRELHLAKQRNCSGPTVRSNSIRAIGRVLGSPGRLTFFVLPLLFPHLFPDPPTYRQSASLPLTADEVLWWLVAEASAGCVLGVRRLLGRFRRHVNTSQLLFEKLHI